MGVDDEKKIKCMLCGITTDASYLCRSHSQKLKQMLERNEGVISQPDFRHHCAICGEYENRIMIEYQGFAYFCNLDIEEISDFFNNRL
ncbi:MAG: hypothetical protein LBS74_02040 [Oscillospiraceae bacterium]|jgi:hypothetical protein|nr:hypothetical protein [Oscillospiraceae bacterium]